MSPFALYEGLCGNYAAVEQGLRTRINGNPEVIWTIRRHLGHEWAMDRPWIGHEIESEDECESHHAMDGARLMAARLKVRLAKTRSSPKPGPPSCERCEPSAVPFRVSVHRLWSSSIQTAV